VYLTPGVQTSLGALAGLVIVIVAWLITPRHLVGWLFAGIGVLVVFAFLARGGTYYRCRDCGRTFGKGTAACPNCGGTQVEPLLRK